MFILYNCMRSLYLLYKYCKTADKFFPFFGIYLRYVAGVCNGRGGGVRWTYYFGLHSARVYAKLRLHATTAARHGTARQVPWLKVSKELHMLSHVWVCVCMCVASFPFSPHTGRQQQPRCMHSTCMACMCAFLHAVVVFALLLWIYGSPCVVLALTHTLTPHAVHKPLCEWVSEWCVCIALNSLLLLQ